jgi:hypothetical protein
MSVIGAVNSGSEPGGYRTPASNPVSVSGSFSSPGVSGFPNAPAAPILSARNNSGSNVRIPYARLVPLRSHADKDGMGKMPHYVEAFGMKGFSRPLQQEYDGLESGELAWIKRTPDGPIGGGAGGALGGMGSGSGFGVDRMQRLCYTGYIEALFSKMNREKAIYLDGLFLNNLKDSGDPSSVYPHEFATLVQGATPLSVPDVATALKTGTVGMPVPADFQTIVRDVQGNTQTNDLGGNTLPQGLDVLSPSPFLHGRCKNKDLVTYKKTAEGLERAVPQNQGDILAFAALYQEMGKEGLFDWTPDGMVLSKLESPAGNPMGSAELDARQAQLFNVAIQGPAVAKTWTGDPLQQSMPNDRVFIVIVADVIASRDAPARLEANVDGWKAKTPPQGNPNAPMPAGTYDAFFQQLKKYKASLDGLTELSQGPGVPAIPVGTPKVELDALNALRGSLNLAEGERLEGTGGTNAVLTNFTLARVTSSFLANYSRVDPTNSMSRLGLGYGSAGAEVYSQKIIGGWCIGNVIDSAASRSMMHHTVRTAPASMALNINVNVEWWSGDRLHDMYYDSYNITRRSIQPTLPRDAPSHSRGLLSNLQPVRAN